MSGVPPSQIGEILMLTLRDFQQRIDEDLRSRGVAGISRRHRAVFLHLNRLGPCRSVDLAQTEGIRPQSMMTIVKELETSGMIERRADPEDSRAKLIYFTSAGEAFIAELARSTEQVWEDYAQLLSPAALDQTFSGLRQLLTSVKENNGHE